MAEQPFDPNSEAALFDTAMIHYNRNQFPEAERLCERILRLNPKNQESAHLRGLVALARKDIPAARKWLTHAFAMEPDPDILLDLADAMIEDDDLKGAVLCCQEALVLAPGNADAHHKLGLVLLWMKNPQAAIASLREALRVQPDFVIARIDLGRALLSIGEYRLAQTELKPVLGLKPPDPYAFVYYGIACHELGEFKQAIESLEVALKLERDPVDTLCNLANVHRDAGNFSRAAEYYERVLALAPDNMAARVDFSHALLARGEFERGWELYESRWEAKGWKDREAYPLPIWKGEPLAGKRVLAWGERGIGDQIMFAGLLPELQSRAASCAVVCEQKLAPLFQRSFPALQVVAQMDQAPLLKEAFDYQVPTGSLGRHLRKSIADFPPHAGYLRADPRKVQAWKQRLDALGPGRKIGISWRGGFVGTRRHLRSIDLEAWLPILKTPGLEFVNLQYTDCAAEIAALRERHGIVLHHWQEAIDDYDETAALVCALDRVVSVCTALVHLAGALGRPAWVLVPAVPEWRYLREGEHMPWYPSVRLFRQPRIGEWGSVIERVAGCCAVETV